jgi:hypothetical protein
MLKFVLSQLAKSHFKYTWTVYCTSRPAGTVYIFLVIYFMFTKLTSRTNDVLTLFNFHKFVRDLESSSVSRSFSNVGLASDHVKFCISCRAVSYFWIVKLCYVFNYHVFICDLCLYILDSFCRAGTRECYFSLTVWGVRGDVSPGNCMFFVSKRC